MNVIEVPHGNSYQPTLPRTVRVTVIYLVEMLLIISALYYISWLEAYMYNRSVHSVYVAAAV